MSAADGFNDNMPMPPVLDFHRLRKQLALSLRQHRSAALTGRDLFSVSLKVPGLNLESLPPVSAPYFYSAQPDQDRQQLGLGEAWRYVAKGTQRLEKLATALAKLEDRWERLAEPGLNDPGPAVFFGMAFDPDDPMSGPWHGLPNSLLWVPRLLLRCDHGQTILTVTCTASELQRADAVLENWLQLITGLDTAIHTAKLAHKHDSPQAHRFETRSNEAWTSLVNRAIQAIRSGQLDKVVPARRVQVKTSAPLPVPVLVQRLARLYPSCLLLVVNIGGSTVVSATPERLAVVSNGTLHCDALGGTTGRSQDPHRDHKLALRLLNSSKAQHEHALVVDAIRSALAPLCDELSVPENPALIKLRNLQHLWTGIKGQLKPGVRLLDAVRQLHPTPAVAGTPTAAACQWLTQHENLQRGWYSGTVGWLQPNGDGELSVLLRCAVLNDGTADLFAGAGIVADSDPVAELQETEMKLHSMLEAMQVCSDSYHAQTRCPASGQRAEHS